MHKCRQLQCQLFSQKGYFGAMFTFRLARLLKTYRQTVDKRFYSRVCNIMSKDNVTPDLHSKHRQRAKPNYFVAIQISNPEIHAALQDVQDHILEQDERLRPCMIALAKLHITLMVMNINDDETHSRSMEALHNVYNDWNKIMCKEPLQLEFEGLGHFRNTVLYANLLKGKAFDRLHELVSSVREHFANQSVYSTDQRSTFTPHLTIAKLSYEDRSKLKIKKIDPLLYETYSKKYFGRQVIEGIQLLSMDEEKTEAGYYKGDELIFNLPASETKANNPDQMVATEEKKEEVRQRISNLVQEALKK